MAYIRNSILTIGGFLLLCGKVWFFPKRKSTMVSIGFLLVVLVFFIIIYANKPVPVVSYMAVNKIIVVDAGHGGTDSGAVRDNIIEKDITLSISKKLAKKLSDAGAAVVMIRSTDTDLVKDGEKYSKRADLSNRVKKANESKADLYISIHTNAETNPSWQGAQTFYNAQSEEGKLLAVAIQDEFIKGLKTKRQALTGDYFVLKNTEMPAVIVEVGFISNHKEGALLVDDSYQDKVAEAIFQGLIRYMSEG